LTLVLRLLDFDLSGNKYILQYLERNFIEIATNFIKVLTGLRFDFV
jgi:hypothetical protein